MRNYAEIFLNAIDRCPRAHVLEIGVGRGEATSLLVRRLKIRQRLTCVDTQPLISKKLTWWIRVDPRVKLVGTTSLKYLESLPPSVKFDCVLIVVDHCQFEFKILNVLHDRAETANKQIRCVPIGNRN